MAKSFKEFYEESTGNKRWTAVNSTKITREEILVKARKKWKEQYGSKKMDSIFRAKWIADYAKNHAVKTETENTLEMLQGKSGTTGEYGTAGKSGTTGERGTVDPSRKETIKEIYFPLDFQMENHLSEFSTENTPADYTSDDIITFNPYIVADTKNSSLGPNTIKPKKSVKERFGIKDVRQDNHPCDLVHPPSEEKFSSLSEAMDNATRRKSRNGRNYSHMWEPELDNFPGHTNPPPPPEPPADRLVYGSQGGKVTVRKIYTYDTPQNPDAITYEPSLLSGGIKTAAKAKGGEYTGSPRVDDLVRRTIPRVPPEDRETLNLGKPTPPSSVHKEDAKSSPENLPGIFSRFVHLLKTGKKVKETKKNKGQNIETIGPADRQHRDEDNGLEWDPENREWI